MHRLFNKLNSTHYHLALVPLIQATGESEITEVTLDTFSYAAVHWPQNKSCVWRQKGLTFVEFCILGWAG